MIIKKPPNQQLQRLITFKEKHPVTNTDIRVREALLFIRNVFFNCPITAITSWKIIYTFLLFLPRENNCDIFLQSARADVKLRCLHHGLASLHFQWIRFSTTSSTSTCALKRRVDAEPHVDHMYLGHVKHFTSSGI